MKILGIDPGSRVTGWGIMRDQSGTFSYLASGIIRMKEKDFPARMGHLFEQLTDVINKYHPDEVGLESIFVHRNASSALKLGHARGVIMLACQQQGLLIHEYAPRLVKQAVSGYGHADKGQVKACVGLLLSQSKAWVSDEADALALAICHANHSASKRWVLV